MIVVDTNLIGYLFLTGLYSDQAEKGYQVDPMWVAPLLWRSELLNVLAGYIRKHILSLEDAQQIMQLAIRVMKEGEYTVNPLGVLELASQCTCSAYDCEFVALAQELKVPLVTADRQMLKDFPGTAISLDGFAAQP